MNAPQRIAVKMARMSTSMFKVGCTIAHGRRVILAGYNQMDKTHPSMGRGFKRLHAEVHAILPAHGEAVGGDAYVCRLLADGTLGQARPCSVCIERLRQHGVKTVHYTDNEGNWVEEGI